MVMGIFRYVTMIKVGYVGMLPWLQRDIWVCCYSHMTNHRVVFRYVAIVTEGYLGMLPWSKRNYLGRLP